MAESLGKTVRLLCEAAYNGNLRQVQQLSCPFTVNCRHRGGSPLMNACLSPNDLGLTCVRHLLSLGADVAALDGVGKTVIHMAARSNSPEVLRLLHLRDNRLINCRTQTGQTPLMVAAACNNIEAVQQIIRIGADTNSADNQGRTAVELADHFSAFSALIAIRNAVDDKPVLEKAKKALLRKEEESKQVCAAAAKCNMTELKFLLKFSNRNCRWRSLTPLMWAAAVGGKDSKETSMMLLDGRADPNLTDWQGRSAMHHAARAGHGELLEHLGIGQLNQRDHSGCTPVMMAAAYGRLKSVKRLIQMEADICTPDSVGCTPVAAADERGHVKVAAALRKALELIGRQHSEVEADESEMLDIGCSFASVYEWLN